MATLTNCSFAHNKARSFDNEGGAANLTDCSFTGNTGDEGGGFYNADGRMTLTNCCFTGNTANVNGVGGMCISGNATTLTNCTFTGNNADRLGGGMEGSNVTLTDCSFIGNTANGGGGLYIDDGDTTLTGCLFNGNINRGGGDGADHGFNPGGGANYNAKYSHLIIRFCSIYSNIVKQCSAPANVSQGGALENDGQATLTDDILWGNTAPNDAEIGGNIDSDDMTITYCDIQGGLSGTGNIKVDPLFVSSTDLHLQAGSPCRGDGITIGTTKSDPSQDIQAATSLSTDADGIKRSNPPSIGAYQYSAAPPKPKKIIPSTFDADVADPSKSDTGSTPTPDLGTAPARKQ